MDTITLKGVKYVLVPLADYRDMQAGNSAISANAKSDDGNIPAIPFAKASIARNLVKARKTLGLTQKQLAEKAGIRPEVLNRAERGVVVPSVRTLRKIDLIVQAHQPSARKRRKRATA